MVLIALIAINAKLLFKYSKENTYFGEWKSMIINVLFLNYLATKKFVLTRFKQIDKF